MAENTRFYHYFLAIPVIVYHSLRVGLMIALYYALHPFQRLTKRHETPPECLMDPKHGTHKYIKVNGIKLHYVEKGDPSKPLMVFIHGFPEFWYSWRYQIEEFSKDYWCIAPDMRGYGSSEKPEGIGSYKIVNILNDIKALVEALDREKFTIVGHDWGALITWTFVNAYGDMVDKFIAMSGPSSEVIEKLLWSEWWQFKHSWYIFFFQCPRLPEITVQLNDFAIFDENMGSKTSPNRFVTADDIEAYKYTFYPKGAITPPVNYYRANFLAYFPPRCVKTVPKGLYLLGEHDAFISRSTITLLAESFEGLKTEVLTNAKHFIQQEEPERVNKLMRDFLKESSS